MLEWTEVVGVVTLTPTLRLDNILIKPVLVICGRKVPENSAGKV